LRVDLFFGAFCGVLWLIMERRAIVIYLTTCLAFKLLVLSLLKKGEKNMRNLRKLEKGEENYEKNVVQQAF